jgi:antitoxin HigA-1
MKRFRYSHPGEVLKSYCEPLKKGPHRLTQDQIAEQFLGISRKHLNYLLKGRVPVTVDTAFRISKAVGNSAEFWLSLQMKYDLSNYDESSVKAKALPRAE